MKFCRKTSLAGASAIAICAASAAFSGEPLPWGLILEGNSIRVGVNNFGTFGNGSEYGSGINFDRTGTGTFDFDFDFLAPGSPYDGFSLSSGSTLMVENNNDPWYTGQNVTGTVTDYSGIARNGKTYDNRAVWSSTMDSVAIEHEYFFNDADLKVQIRTTITALKDLTNLYFGRAVDPDAVVSDGDSSNTMNTFGTKDGNTYVYGEATTSKYLMGLITKANSAEVVVSRSNNSWGFDSNAPTQSTATATNYYGMNPYELVNRPDDDPDFNADGVTSDDVIALGFKLGNLAAGESISFLYSYIFGDDFESFLLPEDDDDDLVEASGPDAAATLASIDSSMGVAQAVIARIGNALARLTQQETTVVIPEMTSGLSISTKGEEARANRLAFRLGALQGGNSETGEVSVGSLTGAYQIDEKLTAGLSYERSAHELSDAGFMTEGSSTGIALYLRSKNASAEGLTWKIAYGISRGDMEITRATGLIGSESGTGSAETESRAASAEIGFGIRAKDNLMALPFMRLSHLSSERGAYTEAADIAEPLSFDKADMSSTTLTIGVDVAADLGKGYVISLGAGLDRDLKSSGGSITGTSSIPGLEAFTTNATGEADDSRVYVSASFRHVFDNGSSLLLTGRVAEDIYSSSAFKTLGVNYEVRF